MGMWKSISHNTFPSLVGACNAAKAVEPGDIVSLWKPHFSITHQVVLLAGLTSEIPFPAATA